MDKAIDGLVVVTATDIFGDVTHVGSFSEEQNAIAVAEKYRLDYEDALVEIVHCNFKTA